MSNPFTIVTLLGIRPDIIRMFDVIDRLDKGQSEHEYKHIFCHTGQHFDYELDELFYKELGVRRPDWNMNTGKTLKEGGGPTSFVHQTGLMYQKTEEMINLFKPDIVVYLGDTNTVLSSVIVSRMGVPVVHIEAGGRSFDWRMPEEKCRTIIDHLSDAHYCYSDRHKENLINEGVEERRITVIGNIIYDALDKFLPIAEKSTILDTLTLTPKQYALVTIHREENTSTKEVLDEKLTDLIRLAEEMPVILPLMPRVKNNLQMFGLLSKLESSKIVTTKPLGYFDFLKLQNEARVIITDSGTVQEEACILNVPALVCRLSTERPETISAGATILSNKNLYENTKRAMNLPLGWDTAVLNKYHQNPSETAYNDIILKLKQGFFTKSRQYDYLQKTTPVKEAYGQF